MISPLKNFEGLNVTLQTNTDCNLQCFPAGTLVYMSDFSKKLIEDIKAGEEILGFDEFTPLGASGSSIFPAKVVYTGQSEKETILIEFESGKILEITPDHPVSSTIGKSHSDSYWKLAGRLKPGHLVRYLENISYSSPDLDSVDYKIGYFVGIMEGDGMYRYRDKKEGDAYTAYSVRVAMKDDEAIERFFRFSQDLGFDFYKRGFLISKKYSIITDAVFGDRKELYLKTVALIEDNIGKNTSLEYMRGYLAGMYDAEGHIDKLGHQIRICNTDLDLIKELERCLIGLGFTSDEFVRETDKHGTKNFDVKYNIRIRGGFSIFIKFLKTVCPAIARKGIQVFYKGFYARYDKVVEVRPGRKVTVYNMETSSRTYIANGYLVHNCVYCYEVLKKPGVLPLDYAKKFLDLILTDPDPVCCKDTPESWLLDRGLILDFIGGDSLMHPELLDGILRYFLFRSSEMNHRWASRWRASISTNGCLFGDEKVRDFLMRYKNNMSLGVSVDGCPEIHDKNRVFADGRGTMSSIMQWWDWYLAYACESASTKSTLNRDSIPYIVESVKFLHEEMRLKQINMNFIFEDMGLTEDDLKLLDKQLELLVDYVLQHKDDLFVGLLSRSFSTSGPMSEPKKGWCGAGAMPCLSVNGKIYPCFRFSPNTMSRDDLDFSVGDVWSGFSRKERFAEVRSCTRDKISPKKCLECEVESGCAWCIAGAYARDGKFFRTTDICEVYKLQVKWSKVYWEEYKKTLL